MNISSEKRMFCEERAWNGFSATKHGISIGPWDIIIYKILILQVFSNGPTAIQNVLVKDSSGDAKD